MRLNHLFSLIIVIILSPFGCTFSGAKGSGSEKKEIRNVPAFSEIHSSGAYTIHISVGPEPRVTVKGDDNLLPLIETTVANHCLNIKTKKTVRPQLNLQITISTPELSILAMSGAGKTRVNGIRNDQFSLELSGAGSVILEGKTKALKLNLSGAGSINAEALKAEEVKVASSGAGKIDLFARNLLDVQISGVGAVSYRGNPKTINQRVSGLGKLIKKD